MDAHTDRSSAAVSLVTKHKDHLEKLSAVAVSADKERVSTGVVAMIVPPDFA